MTSINETAFFLYQTNDSVEFQQEILKVTISLCISKSKP